MLGRDRFVKFIIFLTADRIFLLALAVCRLQVSEIMDSEIFHKGSELIADRNDILDLVILQIQLGKCMQIIGNIFVHQILVVVGVLLHIL